MSRRTAQAGVALIEFALVVPLLILLLVGLMEWGRLMYFGILVGNAAHAGVQYGAQSVSTAVDTAGMKTAAESDGQNVSGLVASGSVVCNWWDGTNQTPSTPTAAACAQTSCATCATPNHQVEYAQVIATGTFHPMFNYHALGIPSSWTISRTAIMRVGQ